MVDELRREVHVADVEILAIDEFFKVIADELLHFGVGHTGLLADAFLQLGSGHLGGTSHLVVMSHARQVVTAADKYC